MTIPLDLHDRLASGSYARKQFLSKDRVIAWSHGSRFRMARTLVAPYAGRRLIDFGCGDGSFVALVHDLFPDAVGVDLDVKHLAECNARFAGWDGLRFCHTDALDDPIHDGSYDVVTCMEVLEHCTWATVEMHLARFARLLATGGRLIVSVPIESGPSLLGKELLRTLAGWRRLGDYRTRETYRSGELLKMALARAGTTIERPMHRFEYAPGRETEAHGHKGFNWKALRSQVGARFAIERTAFSPLGWSRGWCSSQVWLVAVRPAA